MFKEVQQYKSLIKHFIIKMPLVIITWNVKLEKSLILFDKTKEKMYLNNNMKIEIIKTEKFSNLMNLPTNKKLTLLISDL